MGMMTTETMIEIDGAKGEGGGQVLRSALSLSMTTGRPVRIGNIRAGRKRPGLMRQHLTAVRAAQKISSAKVTGAALGSGQLSFEPGDVVGGDYDFAVGTAGSATLVAQTVLPALMLARRPSRVRFEGGTHNPFAPPFHFLAQQLPLAGSALLTGLHHNLWDRPSVDCAFAPIAVDDLDGAVATPRQR